jgi:phosphoribosylanthranilate isomerase
MLISFAAVKINGFKKMLKTKIKAGAVANLTDARYFAAREVEWLGIPLGQGTENAVAPAAAKAFAEWVDGVKIVGEFAFSEAAEIRELHEYLWFDAVQAGMFTPLEELMKLEGLAVIKEVVFEKNATESDLVAHLDQYAACCDYFLLNFEKTGVTWEDVKAGHPFSVDVLQTLCEKYQVILAMDFSPENLDEILTQINPHGLNLTGGEEEKVGLKSFDELDEILDALEVEV